MDFPQDWWRLHRSILGVFAATITAGHEALASVKTVGALCMFISEDKGAVELCPNLSLWPKVITTLFRLRVFVPSPHKNREEVHMCAYFCYMDYTAGFSKSHWLFVCHGSSVHSSLLTWFAMSSTRVMRPWIVPLCWASWCTLPRVHLGWLCSEVSMDICLALHFHLCGTANCYLFCFSHLSLA